jgi:hypothetical protein
MNNRLIKSNDAGGGGCTNTVDLYNPFPDGGGQALYQLNGDATDVSGNYDGTATNVTYGTGVFGQAGVFNGSSSYIDTNFTVPAISSYSASVWFKTSVTGTNKTILCDANSAGQDRSMRLSVIINTSNNFAISLGNGSTSFFNDSISASSYLNNTWHNLVVTYSGTTIKLYINNSLINTYTSTVSAGTLGTQTLKIGRIGDFNGFYFNGSIDQVRIFSRALRPYEVEALYTEEYCTPTIVPSEHFNTVVYSGNGTGQSIDTVGFAPDLVWVKNRLVANYHILSDTVRGVNKQLYTNTTDLEQSDAGFITGFNIDGFDVGNSPSTNTSGSDNMVAWNFKAGGAAVTNTDGTITSQVSANTEAGFSIVSYTGNLTGGATVGHGLNTAPDFVVCKSRTSVGGWPVVTTALPATQYIVLNTTDAAGTENIFNNTYPSDTVFTLGPTTFNNASGQNYIAYCFAEVEGFSSFGSYVGTGASGNTVVTGFEPAFVMMKAYDDTSDWFIVDNKRNLNDPKNSNLRPNNSNAEANAASGLNFLENGFEFTGAAFNDNNVSWIYMAFAADPTTVEPSLEDSFNTVLYTGNGSAGNAITGVGFQPDLIWGKQRNSSAQPHTLVDSVRGRERGLSSNTTNAENNYDGYNPPVYLSSFDTDGFTLGFGSGLNQSGISMVAWAWKGAELPAINSNGSIPSVVSANPAAGFSIVSYTANGVNNSTVGHGLQNTPDFIIVKKRTNTGDWFIYHKETGENKYLFLNRTDAAGTISGLWGSLNSNTFKLISGYNDYNQSGQDYIAYCFAEVAGFSKFGSYTGVIASGNPINVGFEPAFILVKRYNATENWVIFDNKRSTNFLMPDRADSELSAPTNGPVFTSTGFYFSGSSSGWNSVGSSYIYMAFANQF